MIKFNKIERGDIFTSNFKDFNRNNVIKFKKINPKVWPNQGIAVLYGPNGTGKTSFTKNLSEEDQSGTVEFEYAGRPYDNDKSLFHIINDQNHRNIIKGKTDDFLVGDNIKKEYELKDKIEVGFVDLFKNQLHKKLNKEMKLTKQTSPILSRIENTTIRGFVKLIINNKNYGRDINLDTFIQETSKLTVLDSYTTDQEKNEMANFVLSNFSDKKSIVSLLLGISIDEIESNEEISQIPENTDAINILGKYSSKSDCIVCDTCDIDYKSLINAKEENRKRVLESLDAKTKKILDEIVIEIENNKFDPFDIKEAVLDLLINGNKDRFSKLIIDVNETLDLIVNEILLSFKDCISDDLLNSYKEYKKILSKQPKIEEEDMLLITTVINENIDKEITVQRDEENDRNFKILLSNKPLLEQHRDNLELSNGEQNFISLTFELLKAKNSSKDIIIMDDPISSFDSIYKNKIAFCIIKFLEKKKQIILTHNIDLVRLLQHQLQKCFNLYLFNNTGGEENGFIEVTEKEIELLLDMSKLTNLFREEIQEEIACPKTFLLSIVPFLRGYGNLIGSETYSDLSKLMHGYETESIDLKDIYYDLFGSNVSFEANHEYCAGDIMSIDINTLKILKDDTKYPLLDRTLKHTVAYLYTRLITEKALIDYKGIEIKDGKFLKLADIIRKAFHDKKDMKHRVFFTSRKTLLNEFNHFEGNMNIFQPAIDITNKDLLNEVNRIKEYIEGLSNQ